MSTLPQRKIQLLLRPRKLLIADVSRLQPFIVGGDSFREHVEALISYNLRNDSYQQDCIYIEQGHLITPTSFMMYLMSIDPRHTVVVSWMPIPLCILQQVSKPWCPLGLPSSTSSKKFCVMFLMPAPKRPKAGKGCCVIVHPHTTRAQ